MNFRIQEEEEEKKITLDMIYACSEKDCQQLYSSTKKCRGRRKEGQETEERVEEGRKRDREMGGEKRGWKEEIEEK